MGYLRAEEVLPRELIVIIQQYTDGTNIYIPRRDEVRSGWGEKNQTRKKHMAYCWSGKEESSISYLPRDLNHPGVFCLMIKYKK